VLSSPSFSALAAEKKIGKDKLFLSAGRRRTLPRPGFWRGSSANGQARIREAMVAIWARDGAGGPLWNNGSGENV
jgi:hypothetical protein